MSDSFQRTVAQSNGIERITVTPRAQRFDTPLLFVHGMWHAAWVWQGWQARFADWGWQSHAISLPGHGGSEPRGARRFATMGRYLDVVAAEIDATAAKPVLIGHSMGGALIQWYLAQRADDLPAAVLLASWTAQSTYADGLWPLIRRDPWGAFLISATLSSSPYVRDARRVREVLLSPGSTVDATALKARLEPESALVLNQHNPPFWRPKPDVTTPLLWVAAGADGVVTEPGARRSAAFYGASYHLVPDDGHNLMMEPREAETARAIHDWLVATDLG